ncbi:bifunctional alpha/beta hydrolase/OsmC family protein [uncultured Cyclobacterium sp.]|uniref:bifunctional alpha/beta hydrolase/OsmC family protein n=1 Tax=uncultured Cyclobacterium sp. TaxID=453820 RepID=UPI0030EB9D47|tara:strand:- start:76721 stop:77929 length:1209 start_codon:yes stop_codon:yes gene_type:complete
MNTDRIKIINEKGNELATSIDFPNHQKPKQLALFAHCFTCTSQLNAVRNISQALNNKGIAVVRFDFTGLGKSEGNFANSHFEANVEDLLAVNKYITQHYQAPTLMIGHSLGGAAAIVAAAKLDNIQAIVTIGTPADVEHVTKQFEGQAKNLGVEEEAEVAIGGRPFKISGEFVNGFKKHNLPETIKSLRKPILIMHSPSDEIVGINNAHEIYHNAMHPKSFVSLDNANHLLTKKEDSIYVGDIIASWVARYIDLSPFETPNPNNHQLVAHLNLVENNFTTFINTKNHGIIADEPKSVGGFDFGMSPFELVSAGLSACTVMTIKLYAERKKWDLKEVYAYVSHSKEIIDGKTKDVFAKSLSFIGNLDEIQRERLREIASKCPVHKTLQQSSTIKTEMNNEPSN